MTNQTAQKEAFLNHLADKLGSKRHTLGAQQIIPKYDLGQTTLGDKSQAELLVIMQEAASKIHTKVEIVTQAELSATVQKLIHQMGDGNVLFPRDDRFEKYQLTAIQTDEFGYHSSFWEKGAQKRAENIEVASNANLGIAFADFLLAESATVVVQSHAGQGRSLHFLPTHYISIIPESKLVARSTQAASYYDEQLRQGADQGSAVHFISGPSNSGDIEMQLVVGVHGPIEVVYVVVKDC